jgi:pantoate--beta-alanine ligase
MWIAVDVPSLREQRRKWQGPVALVPTMGALHQGHLSLIEKARQITPHVVVSIFVNPTQFGPTEDFNRYPRPIERDLELCRQAGAAGVFNPTVDAVYPPGVSACEISVPEVAADLEGAMRPGHFAGVCRVVAKLFNMVQPTHACFGQKDLQQLRVIEAMVADLNFPLEIVPCETLRDPDGLAMSSRNVYLTPEGRKHGLGISKALKEGRRLILEQGESDPQAVESAMAQILKAHHLQIDYAVVRHARTLAPIDCIEPQQPGRVAMLIAARVEKVRLIDNMLV